MLPNFSFSPWISACTLFSACFDPKSMLYDSMFGLFCDQGLDIREMSCSTVYWLRCSVARNPIASVFSRAPDAPACGAPAMTSSSTCRGSLRIVVAPGLGRCVMALGKLVRYYLLPDGPDFTTVNPDIPIIIRAFFLFCQAQKTTTVPKI